MTMANLGEKNIMEQQVEDLRDRMRLLQQDRRSNLENLEANKACNAEEVRVLRDENKELRTRLNRLQKKSGGARGEVQVLANLQKEMLSMRAEHDNLKVVSTKNKSQLEKLKDDYRICELEAKRPSQEDSPLARRIRTLENRLDKAMIKYNEAQSIRKTYEHIVKRLKDERVSFDNQIGALDRTLQSKQREYEELLLLSGDASHTRDVSNQTLQKERNEFEVSRMKREAELRERQQLVKVRKQMIERQNRREAKRREIMEKQMTDSDFDGTSGKRNSIQDGACRAEEVEQLEKNEQKLDIYEHAFRKIKEATGVSDVNEVIQKISSQEDTSENLENLTTSNQTKIEQLTIANEKLKKEVEDAKYNSSGGNQHRTQVDDYEEKLSTSSKRLEQLKVKHDRLVTTFISAKAGVKHLQDKLGNARGEVGVGAMQLSDSSLIDVLESSENVLQQLLERTKNANDESLLMQNSLGGEDNSRVPIDIDTNPIDDLSESEVQENRPYNQRVKLPTIGDDLYLEYDAITEDGLMEIDEDSDMERDRIKRSSFQILLAQDRKNRQKAKS